MERGGLDREPRVGLISIATRNSPSVAWLCLPMEKQGRVFPECPGQQDPPQTAPLRLLGPLLAAATLPTAQPRPWGAAVGVTELSPPAA